MNVYSNSLFIMKKENANVSKLRVQAAGWLVSLGLLAVAAGIVLPLLLTLYSPVYPWVYASGAVVSLVGRLMMPLPAGSLKLRRLCRMEVWSSMFFCAAAVFMFLRTAPRDWIALTLAGGVLMLYCSVRIPREMRKSAELKNS